MGQYSESKRMYFTNIFITKITDIVSSMLSFGIKWNKVESHSIALPKDIISRHVVLSASQVFLKGVGSCKVNNITTSLALVCKQRAVGWSEIPKWEGGSRGVLIRCESLVSFQYSCRNLGRLWPFRSDGPEITSNDVRACKKGGKSESYLTLYTF